MQSVNIPLVAKENPDPGRLSGHFMPPDWDGPYPALRDGDARFNERTLKLILREIIAQAGGGGDFYDLT